MAADGSISKHDNTIVISQSGDKGKDLIDYLKQLLSFKGNIYNRKPKIGKRY